MLAHVTGATNDMTHGAGVLLLISRLIYSFVYIAGIPYLRTGVFFVGQISMFAYVWQIVEHSYIK